SIPTRRSSDLVHFNGLIRTVYSNTIDSMAISTAEPMASVKLRKIKIPNSESTTLRHVCDTQIKSCPSGKRKLIANSIPQVRVKAYCVMREGSILLAGLELSLLLVHPRFPLCRFSIHINTRTKSVRIADKYIAVFTSPKENQARKMPAVKVSTPKYLIVP